MGSQPRTGRLAPSLCSFGVWHILPLPVPYLTLTLPSQVDISTPKAKATNGPKCIPSYHPATLQVLVCLKRISQYSCLSPRGPKKCLSNRHASFISNSGASTQRGHNGHPSSSTGLGVHLMYCVF